MPLLICDYQCTGYISPYYSQFANTVIGVSDRRRCGRLFRMRLN